MKILGKRGLSGALEFVMLTLAAAMLVCMAAMPWLIKFVANGYDRADRFGLTTHYTESVIFFDYCALFAAGALWQCARILRNINREQPFVSDNVARLRKIAICFAAEAFGFALASIVIHTISLPVFALLFAVFALLMLVCAELFRRAVAYKEENELTI